MTVGVEAAKGSKADTGAEGSTGLLDATWTLINVTQGTCTLLSIGLAYMGWVGGLAFLAVFSLISLLTALLLVQMTEVNGKRISTYIELGEELWGKRGKSLVAVLQMAYLVLFALVNTIFMAQGMQFAQQKLCTATGGGWGCQEMKLTYWTLLAGALQALTAFVPSMAAAAWTSLIGCITVTVFLSMVIVIAFMVTPGPEISYAPLVNGPAEICDGLCVMGFFEGMGGIVLGSSLGQTVLMEIAAPVAKPPKVSTTMSIAVGFGAAAMTIMNYLGAIAGFRAFGTTVGPALLFSLNTQPMAVGIAACFFVVSSLMGVIAYCEPVYHAMEHKALDLYKASAARRRTTAATAANTNHRDASVDDFALDDSVAVSVREASGVQLGRTQPSLRLASLRQMSDLERPSDKRSLRAGLRELSASVGSPNGMAHGRNKLEQATQNGSGGGAHGGADGDEDVPAWFRVFSRFPLRLLYLSVLAFIAICLPFVGDFMGVLAAVGSIPLDFIFPILMFMSYQAQQGVVLPWYTKAGLLAVVALCSGVGAIMLVASVVEIAQNVTTYTFFS